VHGHARVVDVELLDVALELRANLVIERFVERDATDSSDCLRQVAGLRLSDLDADRLLPLLRQGDRRVTLDPRGRLTGRSVLIDRDEFMSMKGDLPGLSDL
jgi:hypothetical protein